MALELCAITPWPIKHIAKIGKIEKENLLLLYYGSTKVVGFPINKTFAKSYLVIASFMIFSENKLLTTSSFSSLVLSSLTLPKFFIPHNETPNTCH